MSNEMSWARPLLRTLSDLDKMRQAHDTASERLEAAEFVTVVADSIPIPQAEAIERTISPRSDAAPNIMAMICHNPMGGRLLSAKPFCETKPRRRLTVSARHRPMVRRWLSTKPFCETKPGH